MPAVNRFRRALDSVRIALAFMTFFGLVLCIVVVYLAYRGDAQDGIPYPLATALGNAVAAYLPLLTAILGFLWAPNKAARTPVHERGEERMEWLANSMAILVFGGILLIPILLYGAFDVEQANSLIVAYHGAMHSVVAGGLVYYFGSKPT
jgi:hypothetical protein